MSEDHPKIREAYQQLSVFLENAKTEGNLKMEIALMKQSLENFVKEDKIKDMIKDAIKEHDEEVEKYNKKRIQWGPIIERIITTLVIVIVTALVIKGMSG